MSDVAAISINVLKEVSEQLDGLVENDFLTENTLLRLMITMRDLTSFTDELKTILQCIRDEYGHELRAYILKIGILSACMSKVQEKWWNLIRFGNLMSMVNVLQRHNGKYINVGAVISGVHFKIVYARHSLRCIAPIDIDEKMSNLDYYERTLQWKGFSSGTKDKCCIWGKKRALFERGQNITGMFEHGSPVPIMDMKLSRILATVNHLQINWNCMKQTKGLDYLLMLLEMRMSQLSMFYWDTLVLDVEDCIEERKASDATLPNGALDDDDLKAWINDYSDVNEREETSMSQQVSSSEDSEVFTTNGIPCVNDDSDGDDCGPFILDKGDIEDTGPIFGQFKLTCRFLSQMAFFFMYARSTMILGSLLETKISYCEEGNTRDVFPSVASVEEDYDLIGREYYQWLSEFVSSSKGGNLSNKFRSFFEEYILSPFAAPCVLSSNPFVQEKDHRVIFLKFYGSAKAEKVNATIYRKTLSSILAIKSNGDHARAMSKCMALVSMDIFFSNTSADYKNCGFIDTFHLGDLSNRTEEELHCFMIDKVNEDSTPFMARFMCMELVHFDGKLYPFHDFFSAVSFFIVVAGMTKTQQPIFGNLRVHLREEVPKDRASSSTVTDRY